MVEREGENDEPLNISSSLSERSLDRNESSSATMVNLNYDSVTNDNLLTLKHSNNSNLTTSRDNHTKMPYNPSEQPSNYLLIKQNEDKSMKEMGKLIGRYENDNIDTISELSLDEFKMKTCEVSIQTDKENAKISILDNHDEYCLCKHCRV